MCCNHPNVPQCFPDLNTPASGREELRDKSMRRTDLGTRRLPQRFYCNFSKLQFSPIWLGSYRTLDLSLPLKNVMLWLRLVMTGMFIAYIVNIPEQYGVDGVNA